VLGAEVGLDAAQGEAGETGVRLGGCFSGHAGILLMKAGNESEGKA